MAKLKAMNSTAVVDVPGGLVDRYVAAGWVKVQPPKPKVEKKSEK